MPFFVFARKRPVYGGYAQQVRARLARHDPSSGSGHDPTRGGTRGGYGGRWSRRPAYMMDMKKAIASRSGQRLRLLSEVLAVLLL